MLAAKGSAAIRPNALQVKLVLLRPVNAVLVVADAIARTRSRHGTTTTMGRPVRVEQARLAWQQLSTAPVDNSSQAILAKWPSPAGV